MNKIIDAAVDHARSVILVLVLVLIAGGFAYAVIAKESKPDINVPIIYVSMKHDGISPEDAERLLVRPMEQELRTIAGIKEMRSTASQGYATVLLEFDAGFDPDQAMQDVRAKIDLVKPKLPDDTEEPTAHEVNVGLFPVLAVTLSGGVPERTLVHIARKLQDDLEALPGVLSAEIAGDREDVLEVLVDPTKLETYNISPYELVNLVSRNNKLIAAGAVDTGTGSFNVKVPGLIQNAKDVLNLPVKVHGDAVVTLADITSVRRTFKDAESFARINGEPGVILEIKKRLGRNIIETIDQVKALVNERRKEWPASIRVDFIQDESIDIRRMLSDLQNNVLSAILLVMVVVVAALGLRTAGLVGLAIPASFLFGILVLYGMGLTMNIVVLFSLILAVGMLVDGAIVVTELADRKMAEGMHRREAYALAAKRMAWPIISSTATTLAAFMPLMFWPDVVGEFMKFLPLTLIVTLTGSLLVALIFVPTLGGIFGKPGTSSSKVLAGLAAAEHGDIRQLPGPTGIYGRLLHFIAYRGYMQVLVLLLAAGSLVGVMMYYAHHGNGVEFFPSVEPERGLVYVHARGNLSPQEKDSLVREVEEQVLRVRGIRNVYARTGNIGQGQETAEDTIGTIFLEFAEWDQRRPASDIFEEIRQRTANLAGLKIEVRKPDAGPPTGKDVQIQLRSRYPEKLFPVVAKIRAKLDSMPNLLDVDDNRPLPGIEWQMSIDRAQAGRFGADVVTVGYLVQLITNGVKVGEYRPDDVDTDVDIRIRFPSYARNVEQLDKLRVPTQYGQVPISNFVTRTAQPKTGIIRRTDAQRTYKVQANVAPGVLADDVVNQLKTWVATQSFGPDIDIKFRGADEKQKESQQFLVQAFFVAMFLMAIILVTQFNSFYHSVLILFAVIMSTVGVILGLIITGQTFGVVMTGIGIVSLAGIVVNNNIVLIDTYAQLRKRGMDALEAVVRTGAQRLRPVMLTTVTTMLGLLPMMLQMNINFITRDVNVGAPSTQWWVQLATAVFFGLGFATILTLLVTPSLLALGANVSERLSRRRARRQSGRKSSAGKRQVEEQSDDGIIDAV